MVEVDTGNWTDVADQETHRPGQRVTADIEYGQSDRGARARDGYQHHPAAGCVAVRDRESAVVGRGDDETACRAARRARQTDRWVDHLHPDLTPRDRLVVRGTDLRSNNVGLVEEHRRRQHRRVVVHRVCEESGENLASVLVETT